MIIRSGSIFKHYTKIDNYITTNQNISDGAFRVYTYYSGLKTGDNFVDNYVCKALGIRVQTLTKRKAELKKAGLILTDQIAPRLYVLYVGNSEISALRVKKRYEEDERKRKGMGGLGEASETKKGLVEEGSLDESSE